MATTQTPTEHPIEACENCGQDQPHEVSIELVVESDKTQNREFSREPYRIAECLQCGTTTRTRMNNA